MFRYFIVNKEVNKVEEYVTVLSGNTVSSTLFNSFFAEYEARVTNKDDNKLISRNNPMELNRIIAELILKEQNKIAEELDKKIMVESQGYFKNMQSNTDPTTHNSTSQQTSQASYIKTEDLVKEIKERNELDDYKREVCHYNPNLKEDIIIKIAKAKNKEEILDILSEAKIASKKIEKDDIITNINRGEKETMKHLNPEKVKTTVIFESSHEQAKEIKRLCDNFISATKKDKTEKLGFTTLEKGLTSEKQQGYLSTRHKKPAPMHLDEALADIAEKENKEEQIIPKYTYTPRITKEQFEQLEAVRKIRDRGVEDNQLTDTKNKLINNNLIVKDFSDIVKAIQCKDKKEFDEVVKEMQDTQKIGIKNNKNKPSLDIVINKQFPKALQLIALATEYGHNKYSEKDKMYDNFRNVEGGSQTYFDANARHSVDRNAVDESGLPHIIHAVWSSLAGLELWAEENSINIKEFSENYMKNLQSKD